MLQDQYTLHRLANGAYTVHSVRYGERMHPGLGPAAEPEILYVDQLKILERLVQHRGEFVVWDIGLGAAANAVAMLRATRAFPLSLRLVSFDDTLEPLAFALHHAEALRYLRGYEVQAEEILEDGLAQFVNGKSQVDWEFHLGDFPSLLARVAGGASPDATPAPHAILLDAFSPAKNPAMWTLPLFTDLFRRLDPARPCNLTTYSRSTMIRVTLLLAGFFVGRGASTGMKEETTIAANTLELIHVPLDFKWLERARRSDCAEPLHDAVYRRAPLLSETWSKLQQHKQFAR